MVWGYLAIVAAGVFVTLRVDGWRRPVTLLVAAAIGMLWGAWPVGALMVVVVMTALVARAWVQRRGRMRRWVPPDERLPALPSGSAVDGDIVYAMAGLDHFSGELEMVKFGITSRDVELRRLEVDKREQTLRVQVLATGPGGRRREQVIFQRLAEWRGQGEWFAPTEPVLSVVRELETQLVDVRTLLVRQEGV